MGVVIFNRTKENNFLKCKSNITKEVYSNISKPMKLQTIDNDCYSNCLKVKRVIEEKTLKMKKKYEKIHFGNCKYNFEARLDKNINQVKYYMDEFEVPENITFFHNPKKLINSDSLRMIFKAAKALNKFLEKNNILYSYVGGPLVFSCLSNNGKHMPWDDDLDIVVASKDRWKIDKIFQTLTVINYDEYYKIYCKSVSKPAKQLLRMRRIKKIWIDGKMYIIRKNFMHNRDTYTFHYIEKNYIGGLDIFFCRKEKCHLRGNNICKKYPKLFKRVSGFEICGFHMIGSARTISTKLLPFSDKYSTKKDFPFYNYCGLKIRLPKNFKENCKQIINLMYEYITKKYGKNYMFIKAHPIIKLM